MILKDSVFRKEQRTHTISPERLTFLSLPCNPPQKLYQTSWRGTGRCDAWVVPNMGVGMQFIDTQSGKVNWESYDEIDITYKIEGKYIIFNSNALYLGGAPWVIKSYTQKHITLIQNEASPDKEKVAIIELDRID